MILFNRSMIRLIFIKYSKKCFSNDPQKSEYFSLVWDRLPFAFEVRYEFFTLSCILFRSCILPTNTCQCNVKSNRHRWKFKLPKGSPDKKIIGKYLRNSWLISITSVRCQKIEYSCSCISVGSSVQRRSFQRDEIQDFAFQWSTLKLETMISPNIFTDHYI